MLGTSIAERACSSSARAVAGEALPLSFLYCSLISRAPNVNCCACFVLGITEGAPACVCFTVVAVSCAEVEGATDGVAVVVVLVTVTVSVRGAEEGEAAMVDAGEGGVDIPVS